MENAPLVKEFEVRKQEEKLFKAEKRKFSGSSHSSQGISRNYRVVNLLSQLFLDVVVVRHSCAHWHRHLFRLLEQFTKLNKV
jgi:hypothetical protein